MNKKYLLFIFACWIASNVHSQSYILLAREKDSSLWKYFNIKGEVVIDKRYPVYYQFTEDGIAVVGNEDLYKLINTKGEEIKTEIDVHIWDDHHYIKAWYSDGLLVTRYKSKFGCLDTLGRIAIPYKYYDLTEFIDGHATARVKRDFFVLDKSGHEIHIEDSTIAETKPFRENLAAFATRNGTFGFIDINGKIVIPAKFAGVGSFCKGLAWARSENDLVGYINTAGDGVIPPVLAAAKNFDNESGLARAKSRLKSAAVDPYNGRSTMVDDWTWVFINTAGAIQNFNIPTEDIDDFSEGLAACKSGRKNGFIDNKGAWIIKPQFDDVRSFKNGFACVRQHGLWGIIDKQGNWVLQPQFEVMKDVAKIK